MVATRVGEDPAAAESKRRWFRADVDGLRAIAIVLVVGYHAGVARFGGGFIGVDVFFVISGFLISRNLLREAETTDRIALSGFWARRIRRLVPALALVVTATLIAGSFVLPRFELGDLAVQGGAAALYVSNMLFAVDAQNYFAADLGSSPFLHTWSLGVEEQFYVVWPLLFSLVCWGQRRRLAAVARDRRRASLIAAFGVAFAVSMGINLVLTARGSSWAFFGLPARAWEFAVAGLLAAVPVPRALRGVAVRTILALGGLAVLAAAVKFTDDSTPYPGLWALLPVTGTVLLIVAGETWGGEERPTIVSRGLALGPMQWLGRVSYSWYLWHWPFIVLATVWFADGSTRLRTIAAAVSLPVAWVAYRYFETPLRFSPFLARSHARTFVVGAGITAGVVVVAGAVWVSAPKAADLDVLAANTSSLSLDERLAASVAGYELRAETGCPKTGRVETAAGDAYCVGGDPEGERSLMLLGDSHAGQWERVLDEVALEKGIRLYKRIHNGCAVVPVLYANVDADDANRPFDFCASYQEGDLALLDELQPDAVVVAQWSGSAPRILATDGSVPSEDAKVQLWEDGVRSRLDELTGRSVDIGWIYDAPTLPIYASKCIAKAGIAACEPKRSKALEISRGQLEAEHRVLDPRDDVATMDMTDNVCDEDRCRLEIDGALTYVDEQHLTDAFTLSLRAPVAQFIDDVMS